MLQYVSQELFIKYVSYDWKDRVSKEAHHCQSVELSRGMVVSNICASKAAILLFSEISVNAG